MSPSAHPGADGTLETAAVTLLDGRTARLVPDGAAWSLLIDGIPQSRLEPVGTATTLVSVQWMLLALGAGDPIRCAHLGGGLLTLPRALAAARPGSVQRVIELEPAIVQLVADRFGLPDGVEVEVADARAWVGAAGTADWDAVTVDVFAGGRIPAPFTSLEFYEAVRDAMRPGGTLVVNSVAGPELDYTRRQLATLRSLFGHVGMIVQGSALQGARFGNATLLASTEPIDVEGIRGALRGHASKGALLTDLDELVGTAEPVTDADARPSPDPRNPKVDEALRMIESLGSAVGELRRAGRALDAARRQEPASGEYPPSRT